MGDILRTENLVKIYHKRTVVSQVSVQLEQGEIVGLLGPNGAGKTTTFYMIVGLIRPNSGDIFLNDVSITGDAMYKRARKGIGYLAQEASVFRQLSVEDNIRSVLEFTRKTAAEQKERLEKDAAFNVWEPLADGRFAVRFVTSWATKPEDVEALKALL